MTSRQWRAFFEACSSVLGDGAVVAAQSANWCSWTTFQRLHWDAGYWQTGLPRRQDIGETGIEGGSWLKPVLYAELAHVIVPGRFYREPSGECPEGTYVEQDIAALSRALAREPVDHRLTEYLLEIKLY